MAIARIYLHTFKDGYVYQSNKKRLSADEKRLIEMVHGKHTFTTEVK